MFDLNMLRPLLLSRGLYPDDVPGLIRYAALGLTNLCWRNSILEDWHAGDGPLSDADMMMENARTSIIARRALVQGLDPDDEPIVDLLQDALDDFLEVPFDPCRPLNCGSTLVEVAGDDLDELTGHTETQVAALLDNARNQGTGVVLAFLALKGLLGCAEWFGSWRWPPTSTGCDPGCSPDPRSGTPDSCASAYATASATYPSLQPPDGTTPQSKPGAPAAFLPRRTGCRHSRMGTRPARSSPGTAGRRG